MLTHRSGHREASPRPRTKKVRVGSTRVGLGVFAGKRYEIDAIIGEIEGQVIDDPDYHSVYCMDMGDSRCLEPSAPFRFVNHSCEPNCSFQWFDLTSPQDREPRRRVFLLALADIAAGEELTIDYRWPPQMAIPCGCGAETCRGWIVAAEELEEFCRTAEPSA